MKAVPGSLWSPCHASETPPRGPELTPAVKCLMDMRDTGGKPTGGLIIENRKTFQSLTRTARAGSLRHSLIPYAVLLILSLARTANRTGIQRPDSQGRFPAPCQRHDATREGPPYPADAVPDRVAAARGTQRPRLPASRQAPFPPHAARAGSLRQISLFNCGTPARTARITRHGPGRHTPGPHQPWVRSPPRGRSPP